MRIPGRFSPARRATGLLMLLVLLSSCAFDPFPSHSNVTIFSTGITVSVTASGAYIIKAASPAWTFSGTVGQSLSSLATGSGRDAIGSYQEVTFNYQATSARRGGIRVYDHKPVVLFSDTYLEAASNNNAFPRLTTYPRTPNHLTYSGTFALHTFSELSHEGPWVFFDNHKQTFILSPASDFMLANTAQEADGSITSGINPAITSLPRGFTHRTLLVLQQGINATFETWGHALTDLQGKFRPASDVDASLKYLGYWTDGGAYYYNYIPSKGYQGTLLALRDSFKQKGVPLGYIELDSWWYPKGQAASWQGSTSLDRGGIYTYMAAPTIFPQGLSAFQQQLGLPMGVHARWIDPSSPYRLEYQMSNNVVIDPRYWNAVATYLKNSGVIFFKQDWLNHNALPAMNLNDPNAFMDNMARAMAANGIDIQYCMDLSRHILQSTRYSNATTLRVSDDHFKRSNWDSALYTSQLANAVGLWPWDDYFNSTERDNLLLATLSAGVVGVSDPLGAESRTNLLQSVRSDGVIVKPDVPIVPIDDMYVQDVQNPDRPMVASTYTDHAGMKALYVFAYKRGNHTRTAFTPASLGLNDRTYVYNYFTGKGTIVKAGGTFNTTVKNTAYYIAVPIGPSGIAFLGDAGKFASLGKQRVTQLSDKGVVRATVSFARGEQAVTLYGFSPAAPSVSASAGSVGPVVYNASTHLFHFTVSPASEQPVALTISAYFRSA